MMHRTWKEVVVCRWRMIGLLALCLFALWSGRRDGQMQT